MPGDEPPTSVYGRSVGYLERSVLGLSRKAAGEIWRGERLPPSRSLAQLHSERALRSHLKKLAQGADPELQELNWETADSYRLLVQTERALEAQPILHGDFDMLFMAAPEQEQALMELLIVQSIGGRLNLWPARDDEQSDAHTARSMSLRLESVEQKKYEALMRAGDELFRVSRFREAASCLMLADRYSRSVLGLMKAALSFWKLEEWRDALWTIRVCLLEGPKAFPSPQALLKAQIIESRLVAIVESGYSALTHRPILESSVRNPFARAQEARA